MVPFICPRAICPGLLLYKDPHERGSIAMRHAWRVAPRDVATHRGWRHVMTAAKASRCQVDRSAAITAVLAWTRLRRRICVGVVARNTRCASSEKTCSPVQSGAYYR